MELDETLPSKWNVITKCTNHHNDQWSTERFGTINITGDTKITKRNKEHNSAHAFNFKVHDCPSCQCQNVTNNNTNTNNNFSQNNFSSWNTSNCNVHPFHTNTNTNITNNCNNNFDDSDGETIASNDSERSKDSSIYSSDIQVIDDNNIIEKEASESSDNISLISNTELDGSDNEFNHNMVNNMPSHTVIDPSNTIGYTMENYNYTDWIANSNENDSDMFDNDAFYDKITEKDMENDKKEEQQNEEYNNQTDLNEDDRNWKFKGHVALRQIRRYQRSYGLLISKEEFISEIGNVIYNMQNSNNAIHSIPIEIEAIHPLQESVEAYIIELFEDAQIFSIHAERESVNESDIKCVLKMRQNKMKNFKWLNDIIEKYVN